MLDVQIDGAAAVITAQSEGHADKARYAVPTPALRAAMEQTRGALSLEEFERFEHAWVSQVIGAVTDARAAPGIRRYISQAFDDEALSRGLLLRGHWHCPRCGSPGSQWSAGCLAATCPHPGPASDAQWDHCRVASRDDLLTLMVSEGYQRAGSLAAGDDVKALDAEWQTLRRGAPPALAAELSRWVERLHEAYAARTTDALMFAARLGHAIDLANELDPERQLESALSAAGYAARAEVAA